MTAPAHSQEPEEGQAVDAPKERKLPPSTLQFWGLMFTAVCYGMVVAAIVWMGPRLSFLDRVRSLDLGIKYLIMAGAVLVALPKTIIALLNVKKLLRSLHEVQFDKGEWAQKAFIHASGFEIVCLLGLVSHALGFHLAWAIAGLLVGTACKLCYAPAFMKLRRLALEQAIAGAGPAARARRSEQ